MFIRVLALVLLIVVLSACEGSNAPATPTPLPTATLASPTAMPRLSPTVIVVATSTTVPTSAATSTVAPTDTPIPTETTVPTEIPLPPTLTPIASTSTPEVQQIESGGLGLSISQWEAMHGPPSGDGPNGTYYEGQKYDVVSFDGPIQRIFVTYGDARPASVEVAQLESKTLIPNDAKLLQSRKISDIDSTVYSDVYRSESLAAVIDALPPVQGSSRPWRGADPGTFEVRIRAYEMLDGGVPWVSIALGKDEE